MIQTYLRFLPVFLFSAMGLISCFSGSGSVGELKIAEMPQSLAEFRAAPLDLESQFLREPMTEEGVYTFGKNDMFVKALKILGAPESVANEIASTTGVRCGLDVVKKGKEMPYKIVEGEGLVSFSIPCGDFEIMHAAIDKGKPQIKIVEIPHSEVEKVYAIVVQKNSSMIASASKYGITENQVMSLANVFRSDIDFNNDIHPGDELRLWVREIQDDSGNTLTSGKILTAVFVIDGKEYWGINYSGPEGKGYFDRKGNNLRKSFIKSPLPFLRVTSGFTLRRFHPILGKNRPHLGVDFGAPTGTPVLAAAEGRVTYAGYSSGYGNQIKIAHNASLWTQYAHLSKIKVKKGQYVKQGRTIGLVGSTGLSTGPHLHYGMYRNNKAIDPLGIKMDTTSFIGSAAFKAIRDRAVMLLSNPKPGNVSN